ncbi:hypothetical protein ACERZ8_16840 [Tateyamaria armeniaca]|uniref:Uncharacterized protein n=1 Tax=Tateyamaria armeniaca TaxID=2518930 RepID=A0ABW8UWC6_9RHOB
MGLLSLLSAPFRRGPRRPMATRQPGRDEMGQMRDVPLGMEATDLDLVDRVNRRNDALERTSAVASRRRGTKGSFTAAASTKVDAMPEDETYAARYHRAFNEKDD